MGRFLKNYLGPFFWAVLTTVILAVIFQSQSVIGDLNAIGADVTLGERVSTTLKDLTGLGPLYAIFITLALLIAFFVAGFIARKKPALRVFLFIGAGAVAMIVLLYAMKAAFFGVHIIAGARDLMGQFFQMFAGAAGGYVFFKRAQKNRHKQASEPV